MKQKEIINEFVTAYSKSIDEKAAAVFIGAGLSKPSGFVDWKNLLRPIANSLKLDIDQESDLISLTQFYVNEHSGRNKINQLILDEFSKRASHTENHAILSRLPISTYWTTNYDTLIEDSLKVSGKTPDVKSVPENLALNQPQRDATVYKMHGDINQPDRAVITKDDYENFSNRRQLFSTALQGDLVQKTFLFLGFSFSDPNIDYILSRVRILLENNRREHYCIMRKVQKKDFKNKNKAYSHAEIKQALQIKDLQRYGVQTILVDEYKDITNILRRLEYKNKLKKVFISGSAEKYDPFKKDGALKYVHKLSHSLCKSNYSIVTGFGWGIGSAVINGALEYVFSTSYRHIDEHLTLRPFPQFQTGKESLPELWNRYRENMLQNSGVAIFIFGNKTDSDGHVINANGVFSEFEIAHQCGVKVLPVGITGYASKELWQKVWKNKTKYLGTNKKVHALFKKLNDDKTTLHSTIKIISDIIEIYTKEQ